MFEDEIVEAAAESMVSTESKRLWRDTLTALLRIALSALIIATLAGFTARYSVWTELLVHFKPAYLTTAIFLALVLSALKQWRWAAVCVVLIAIHAPGIARVYLPPSAESTEDHVSYTLLVANVLSSNANHAEVVEYIRERRPDAVLLQEVTPRWLTVLKTLESDGYSVSGEARFDNFGMATLTRIESSKITSVDLTAYDTQSVSQNMGEMIRNLPVMEIEFIHAERPVQILNIHPFPPVGAEHARARNKMLELTRHYIQEADNLVIVAGDLNVTPWSPVYKDAFRESEIVNARQGFGIFPTYPTFFPLPLMIPIDHVLVSPEIAVTHLEYTPDWGSDHLGLWVELAIPAR